MAHVDSEDQLRILIANQDRERLQQVTSTVVALGHAAVLREGSLEDIGAATAAERPDLALVIVEESSRRALSLIDKIVREATCPVIAILDVQDRDFVNEAAKRGIFAYIADGGDRQELQSSIDVALRRFSEYHGLEGAFSRRAVMERAKGILMERHSIDEQTAFNMLRDQARRSNRKVVDVADAVVSSLPLLPGPRAGFESRERLVHPSGEQQ
jgi:AmiR/NasT family two-component response regulator